MQECRTCEHRGQECIVSLGTPCEGLIKLIKLMNDTPVGEIKKRNTYVYLKGVNFTDEGAHWADIVEEVQNG